MKAFFYDEENIVIDIVSITDTASADKVILAEDVPPYVPKDGYGGVLKVVNGQLKWEYEEVPPIPVGEVTDEELGKMVKGVM